MESLGVGFGFLVLVVWPDRLYVASQGIGIWFLSLFGTIWVHWSGLDFCGMSISRFWLNLVNEAGWLIFGSSWGL